MGLPIMPEGPTGDPVSKSDAPCLPVTSLGPSLTVTIVRREGQGAPLPQAVECQWRERGA
jgi:hypothetical protein